MPNGNLLFCSIIAGKVLFDNYGTDLIEELGIEFEHYPNRNSMQYIDLYGLHDTKKMIRGTYRLVGISKLDVCVMV